MEERESWPKTKQNKHTKNPTLSNDIFQLPCLSEIFQTVYIDSLSGVLHVHSSFYSLHPFRRPQEIQQIYDFFSSSHSQCVLTEELSWWFFLWCNNTEMLIILLAIIVIWSCSAKIVLFLVIVFGYILILYSDMYFCSFWTEYWSAYSLTLLYWYLFISG